MIIIHFFFISGGFFKEIRKILGANTRVYSCSLLQPITSCNHLPFIKIFSGFVHCYPNFQIFSPFSTFLCSFSEESHLCMPFLSRIGPAVLKSLCFWTLSKIRWFSKRENSFFAFAHFVIKMLEKLEWWYCCHCFFLLFFSSSILKIKKWGKQMIRIEKNVQLQ